MDLRAENALHQSAVTSSSPGSSHARAERLPPRRTLRPTSKAAFAIALNGLVSALTRSRLKTALAFSRVRTRSSSAMVLDRVGSSSRAKSEERAQAIAKPWSLMASGRALRFFDAGRLEHEAH